MDKELEILLHEKAWDRAADLKHISDHADKYHREYISVSLYLNTCYQETCEELKSKFTPNDNPYISCVFCFHNEITFCVNCKNELPCKRVLEDFSRIFNVLSSKNFREISEELIKKHEINKALEKVCEAAKKIPIPEQKELTSSFNDDLPF